MDLFDYYNIDECKDRKKIFDKLDQLKKDGKIEYEMEDRDVFTIEDLDLEESDIEDLNKLFDEEDVFPHLDHDTDEEDDNYDDYDYDN
jgi:hypothetical protein